jgi:hypothetical protein
VKEPIIRLTPKEEELQLLLCKWARANKNGMIRTQKSIDLQIEELRGEIRKERRRRPISGSIVTARNL